MPGSKKCTCPDETDCGLRRLMIDVRNAIANILDRHTLENVVEVTLRKQEQCATQPKKKPREKGSTRPRHANPSDGFLAVLLEPKP